MIEESLPQVIPVLDLSKGRAVHAVRGRRREYLALKSVLASGSDPVEIARALIERCGFDELYVADLDAIQDRRPQFDLIQRLVNLPAGFLLDLGIRSPDNLDEARGCLGSKRCRYVLATETLAHVDDLRRAIDATKGPGELILGLDFVQGTFRTDACDDAGPVEVWMNAALGAGVDSVVALDLDRVGSEQGFAWPTNLGESQTFRSFARKISGGGIRSLDDVRSARQAGCDSVLVGSALHDGRISPADLTTIPSSERAPRENR